MTTFTSNLGWHQWSNSSASGGSTGYYVMPMNADPFIQGSGPPECSTCTDLARVTEYIFDVNGYYRDLGVDPNTKPRPSRADLRHAYFDRDGMSSERLTYVMKMLLSPEIRAFYDSIPLGQRYFDMYEQDKMKKRIQAKQSKMMAEAAMRGEHISERREKEMAQDLWREHGFDVSDPGPDDQDSPEEMVDLPSPEVLDQAQPAEDPNRFDFAYYLWRTNLSTRDQLGALARWQEHLINAFSRRGVRIQIAVGLHGHMVHPAVSARVGYREVFFLHHLETPTADLAHRMADQWLRDHSPSHTSTREIEP